MKRIYLALLCALLTSCEPFNLDRINFATCTRPSARVGATVTRLQATLFVDQLTGDVGTVNWTFGDGRGLPQTGDQVYYTYDRPGTYTVTMALTNRCNQTYTTSRTISVAN